MNVPSDANRRAALLRASIGVDGPIEVERSDLDDWINVARQGRAIPLLSHLVHTSAPTLLDWEKRLVASAHRDVMAPVLRLEHAMLRLLPALERRGIRYALLKGAVTAHLDYSDPSLRQFGDVDLLIDPSRFADVLLLLPHEGWNQAYPLPRNHERFAHAVTFRDVGRSELDVHRRIAHRGVGELIDPADLLEERVRFEIAGAQVWALSRPDRMVHAAVHQFTSRGEYRKLSSVADVLVLATRCLSDVDVVLERAESWSVRSFVERAVLDAFSEAQVPLPAKWEQAMATPRRRGSRLVEHAYLADRRRPVAEEIAYMRFMASWRDRVAYVRGYLATDAEYAAHHRRSGFVAQARYLWSRVRRPDTD